MKYTYIFPFLAFTRETKFDTLSHDKNNQIYYPPPSYALIIKTSYAVFITIINATSRTSLYYINYTLLSSLLPLSPSPLPSPSFCPSLAVIASVLRLSDNIAGVTILAFGNGAPDIFTSLVSGADESIIMFTELIGAGVFVTTIIAGSVSVVKPFRVELKFMMRDACFYIMTVLWISFVVRDHRVHLWEAASTYLPFPPPPSTPCLLFLPYLC